MIYDSVWLTNGLFFLWFNIASISPFSYDRGGRVNIAGYNAGLTVVLDTISEEFAIPIGRSSGFKVLVHNPREYPMVDSMGFTISPGFETFAGISERQHKQSKSKYSWIDKEYYALKAMYVNKLHIFIRLFDLYELILIFGMIVKFLYLVKNGIDQLLGKLISLQSLQFN